MDAHSLRELLDDVAAGRVDPDAAVTRLRRLPFADLGHARVDHHRALRQGLAEAVYGPGKTPEQCASIVAELLSVGHDAVGPARPVLLTRASEEQAAAALAANPGGDRVGDTVIWRAAEPDDRFRVVVAAAGTADLAVADECAAVLTAHGIGPQRLTDVGVAGVHRLLGSVDDVAEADVVVVDRLAPRALLDALDPQVEVVDAGKAPHRQNVTQEEINALLVDRARRGLRVVRLKGGDPFVFGRGGEEVAACARAGVPVEVVPGVTSALAAPAAAGIPVTHRGVAADVAIVAGHLDPSRPGSTVDWQALADGPATLVLLMALEHLDHVTAELVKRGRPADTPVAVVRRATLPDQQVLVATLATVAGEVRAAGLRPPAVVVVGAVVRLREVLW